MKVVVVVLALFLVACTKTNPLDCSEGTCTDPMHPYCDKDGTVGGTANACIAVSCAAPSEFVKCQGDVAVACNGTGDGYDLTTCPMGCADAAHGCNMCTPDSSYCMSGGVQHCGSDGAPTTFDQCMNGCSSDPMPHCLQIVPRYVDTACDVAATDDLDIGSNATFGTDLDTACTGGVVHQTAAPDICVVRNRTITIESAATLKVTGGRLLALVADGALDVHGVLDASADNTTSGPGACDRTSGGGPTASVGGGGAGFETAGGAGANASTDGGAVNGGAASTNAAQLAVLVGAPCATGGGGGGGGGVTLVSCGGTVTIDGTVDMGGGGGNGGGKIPMTQNIIGAHGGGAGGNLVIQAFNIVVTGNLYANGGAGGAGYTGTASGNRGADAPRASTYGAAGGAAQSGEGAGGDGAFGSSSGTPGKHPPSSGTGGGGGGGVGFLQTYTPMGVTPTVTPADVSPPLQSNLTIQTK